MLVWPVDVACRSPRSALEGLSTSHPLDALTAADEHRAALVEPLLATIERCLEEPYLATAEDANLFSHALYSSRSGVSLAPIRPSCAGFRCLKTSPS